MCGRSSRKQTHACGHTLPLKTYDEYAHLLAMCLANPSEPRTFEWEKMRRASRSTEECRFCKEGEDIDGEWAYGKNWLGASQFEGLMTREEEEEEGEEKEGKEEGM